MIGTEGAYRIREASRDRCVDLSTFNPYNSHPEMSRGNLRGAITISPSLSRTSREGERVGAFQTCRVEDTIQ